MHIAEGVLTVSQSGVLVLGAGWVGTALGTSLGLARMDYDQMPRVALLGSAFFVASAISFPLGVTWVHLVLCGLMGLILGWSAFPAILIGLFLQLIMFGQGGPTALGVNTFCMAAPAVACHYLFGGAIRARSEWIAGATAFAAGTFGLVMAASLHAGTLWCLGAEFHLLAGLVLLIYAIQAVLEGAVTACVVGFLRKVRPELLDAPSPAAAGWEVADVS